MLSQVGASLFVDHAILLIGNVMFASVLAGDLSHLTGFLNKIFNVLTLDRMSTSNSDMHVLPDCFGDILPGSNHGYSSLEDTASRQYL